MRRKERFRFPPALIDGRCRSQQALKGIRKSGASGQNERSFPVITQYIDDKPYVVWPKALQTREPVLPLPASSPYAER